MSSVPKLRFREFKSDWANCRLIDVAELQRGFDLPSANRVEGIVPIVSSGGITGFHCEPKVQPPGIVMGRYGSIGEVFYVEQPFWPLNTALWVKDFKENLPKFAYYLLSTIDYSRYSDKTGVPGVNRNDLHIIKVGKPDGSEQKKIAAFLTAVDTKIEQLTQKEALLKQYKKGVIQKIFSQEIRFKADDGSEFPEWEEKRLSEVLHEHKSRSTGSEEIFSVSVHKGLVNQVEHLGRSFAASDTSNYNLVKPNDIVYTKSPTGYFPYGIIKQSRVDKDVLVSPLYGVFTPESVGLGYMLHVYFESVINTHNYLHSIIQKGAKNTINITNTTFTSKSLKLPASRDEQNKIGQFLSTIDTKIDQITHQLEAAKTFKKGLLQQMFV